MTARKGADDSPAVQTVVLDANVLVPQKLRSVLLDLAYGDTGIQVRWSKAILEEVRRARHRDEARHANGPTPEEIDRRVDGLFRAMNATFADALVPISSPRPCELPDPDDCHVLATAQDAGAHVIVTNNIKDFPAAAAHPSRVLSADAFLLQTWQKMPDAISDALIESARHTGKGGRRQYSPADIVDALEKCGCREFAAEYRAAQQGIARTGAGPRESPRAAARQQSPASRARTLFPGGTPRGGTEKTLGGPGAKAHGKAAGSERARLRGDGPSLER